MSHGLLFEIVCYRCQRVLASEQPDGDWTVKIRERVDGRWRTVDLWHETFACPGCRAEGIVNALDLIYAPRDRAKQRVPTRRLV